MVRDLPPDIWFVRSNGGSGSYPVRREGWRVVLLFVSGMIGWGLVAGLMVALGVTIGPSWLPFVAPVFFVVGAALSAWYFIDVARRHTDHTLTYSDFLKDNENA